MANAYSQLHNYDRELQTYDFNLIANALSAKEQGLAQGRAMVDQADNMLDQLGLEIHERRPQDREYFQQRYNQAKSIVDKYRAGDLSDPNLANQLVNKLSEVMKDERLVNAVVGSKLRKAEEQEWARIQREEPDKYSENNHKLARQNAEEWYANEEVGAKYKGGGGVIEYDDYRKRVNDNILKIAEFLNAKHVYTKEGTGVFIDQVTKKEVDRGQLEGAIKAIIGEKGMRQMSIDAWATYDDMDNETLKSQYDAYIDPKIQENQRYIDTYKNQIATLEEGSQQYKQAKANLAVMTQAQDRLKGRSWDNLVKGGEQSARKQAYTNMYSDRVIGTWVDSYAISSIESIKVDDNDYKTKMYKDQIRRTNIMEAKEKRLSKGADAKAAGKNNLATPGSPNVLTGSGGIATLGDKVDVDAKDLSDEITQIQTGRATGYQAARAVIGKDASAGDLAQLAVQMSNGLMGKVTTALRDGGTVTLNVGGKQKEVKVTPEVYANLLTFNSQVVQLPPGLKQWREASMVGIEELTSNLSKQIAQDPEKAVNFPTFRGQIVEEVDGEGNPTFALRGVNAEENRKKSYYTTLLEKKGSEEALTVAEEKTLDMYTRLHLISDPDIALNVRQEMLAHLRDDLAGTLSNSGRVMDIIPSTVEDTKSERDVGMSDMFNVIGNAVNPIALFSGGVGDALEPFYRKSSTIMEVGEGTGWGTVFSDPTPSELGPWDTDYEGETAAFSAQISDFSARMLDQTRAQLSEMSEGITQNKIDITKALAPEDYKIATAKVVSLTADKINTTESGIQGEVSYYRDLDETQTPTGGIHYAFTYKETGSKGGTKRFDSKKEGTTPLTEDQIKAMHGFGFAKVRVNSPYAATSLGKYAAVVDAGPTNYDSDLKLFKELSLQDPAFYNNSLLSPEYVDNNVLVDYQGNPLQGEDAAFIKSAVSDYDKGEYSTKLIPVENEGYVMQLYRSGEPMRGIVSGVIIAGDPTESEIINYLMQPDMVLHRHNLILTYINNEKAKIERNKLNGGN